jgi:7-cyano-7-deazaguanine reductase
MIESKSFKLYLNSLNNERFESEGAAIARIVADISDVAGSDVALQLLPVDDPSLAGGQLEGDCLDSLAVGSVANGEPVPGLLSLAGDGALVEEMCYSHLLRSLCPVTGQPDWASVWLHYRGRALDRVALLRYLLAFRNHHEFHEQCIERMFRDITGTCDPEFLHIQGFYTRRGGMDINPFRSTDPVARALPRLNRQ